MVRRRLHGGADEKENSEEHEGFPPSEAFVQEGGGDGTEETAGGEQGDDVGGDLGVLAAGESGTVGGEAKVLLEAGQGEDAAHDTSVIT